MKCPYCSHRETRIIDKRPSGNEAANRRRRECLKCGKRFTTYEKIDARITQIRKRDGRIADFNQDKITTAIWKAAQAVGGTDRQLAKRLADQVVEELNRKFHPHSIPSVEEIQDVVEKVLIESGHARTAKAYILYRAKRTELREKKKAVLGMHDDSKLTVNGLLIAKEKYLRRNEEGRVAETPHQMFRRVAQLVAQAEQQHGDSEQYENRFFEMMASLEFLPAGRTLANAGGINQLANGFVLPVNDSMEGIFQTLKEMALVQKASGGTGFNFSHIRPKGDVVQTAAGIASGPVSFMKIFSLASAVVKQTNRKAANMGILRIDHPDIIDFITIKEQEDQLQNFNISVAVTDAFMKAVEANQDYDLINPRTGRPARRLNARKMFDLLILMAWKIADPGILFLDRINASNPTAHLGPIEATSPCGEIPLHAYEACNLGSLNLSAFVRNGAVDWGRLKTVASIATRFLDDVIDVSRYPLKRTEEVVKANRRIGLGVMGWADMLYQLKIPYNSDQAVELAEQVMQTIHEAADRTSQELAAERGAFPNWKGSVFEKQGVKRRNATVTAISPTGTLSMLTDTSPGIEPNFAISFVKKVLDGREILHINRYFEAAAREQGFSSEELMRSVAEKGTLAGFDTIPEEVRRVFVVAHDITPEWHVAMQAAFQRHVENAISKTINFPNTATPKHIEDAYLLAYRSACKGLTIYRDGTKESQIIAMKAAEPLRIPSPL